LPLRTACLCLDEDPTMNQDHYDALVAGLGSNERGMLDVARRLGKAKVSELRPATVGRKTGLPLAYGLTRELRALEAAGLLRRVKGVPARYEAVKPAEVEDAAHFYSVRKRRSRKKRSARSRIVELRANEVGNYSEFYRVHRYLVEATEYITHHLSRMAFWEAAPKEDLARSVDDMANLIEAVDQALTILKERADDDALIAKIEKLEKDKGRTAAEKEAAQALARRLRAQYEDRLRA
jgi:hypothetical protein